jgi:adenylosuccinate lyase
MTSQDVVCNADALILRDSLGLIAAKAARVVAALGAFAEIWKAVPTLGLTHFQPAQPTTVGRRAAMWGYDIWLCLTRIERSSKALRPRGLKGATGTQASFLALLGNDAAKVEELERAFLERAGWGLHGVHTERVKSSGETPPPPSHDTTPAHVVTGQTYPRIEDAFILSDLAAMGAVLHKVATDIRLLCGRKELDEPFGDSQIGSSAMPYKRNPMRCERVCGLSRFVMNLAQNGLDTAATQWLERTLDDSSNRRLSLPEAFLALDGCLDLVHSVIGNEGEALEVHQATVRANLMAELPFMATENLMIEAVRLGRDRQEVHEAIRGHSQAAGMAVKVEGRPNDLLERLTREPLLEGVDIAAAMAPERYVGLAPLQVDRFLEQVVRPLRERYADQWRRLEATEPQV